MRAALREKFEDTGLSADHLGTISFDVLVQDMVGAFYFAAAKEPALQASLQISLLRQMAERMGALERLEQLAQRQGVAGEQPVDLLTQIRHFIQQAAAGQGNPNELLLMTDVPNSNRPWRAMTALIETDWYPASYPWHAVIELDRQHVGLVDLVLGAQPIATDLMHFYRERATAASA